MRPRQPKPPAEMTPAQLGEFRRVARELGADVASEIGGDAIAAYSVAYCRWRQAEAQLAESGDVVKLPNGYPGANPYLVISTTAARQMKQFQDRVADARRHVKKTKAKQRPMMRIARDDDDDELNAAAAVG